MLENQKKEVFRLAAVLYADNNYEVNTKTIHRKIIESAFLDIQNSPSSTHQIINHIEKYYGLIFDDQEVNNIFNKDADTHFLIHRNTDGEIIACLTAKRYNIISAKVSANNIDFFINEFLALNSELISLDEGKSIIYRFLYEIYSNNISSFSKLIDHTKELEKAIDLDETFKPLEKKIINEFLRWENDGKNKAIFDISSYALEYCMITNKGSNQTFHLRNLKNKDFYLDTNILFRAIGINGENRKDRTTTFLTKFVEAGENLFISKYTEAEYKSTIKYYVGQISKRVSSKVNARVFARFKSDSEFFDYYHRWRVKRLNDDAKYFEAHLMAEYEGVKKRFGIVEDYNIGFDEKNEEIKSKLTELAQDIYTHKNQESMYYGRFATAETDAKNIFLIKNRRNGQFRNIFETRYFFVSSDQGLRRWDFKQTDATPVVLLPSQWMSILLRYINRTNDDFKSFVSFLNLSQNESNISNEKLDLILGGISEITTDFEQQSYIVEHMVQAKFQGILEKSFSDEEVVEQSRLFAKTQLETDLIQIKEQKENLEVVLDAHKQGAASAILKAQEAKDKEHEKAKSLEAENIRLRNHLMEKDVSKKMFWWWGRAVVVSIMFLVLIFFYIGIFFSANRLNYSPHIANWIDSLPSDSVRRNLAYAIYLIPAMLFAGMKKVLSVRLSVRASVQARENYREKWMNQYRK